MIYNKKIYKYTSIISFTIAIVLITNLILPMFSIANDNIEPELNSSTIQKTEVTPIHDNITIEKCRLNNEDKTLYLKINSELGIITLIKYYISDDNLEFEGNTENQNLIKNNGKAVNVSNSSTEILDITDTTIDDNKKIYMYVESNVESNNYSYWELVGRYGNIEVGDSIPWAGIVLPPEETPGEIPGEKPGEIPGEVPEEVPGEIPGEVPGEIPGEIPEETPSETPDEIPDETPEETPGETPDETPDVIPDETPEDTLNGTEDNNEDDNLDKKEEPDEDLPQAGSNDSFVIVSIIIFLIIGIVSFTKYKTIK